MRMMTENEVPWLLVKLVLQHPQKAERALRQAVDRMPEEWRDEASGMRLFQPNASIKPFFCVDKQFLQTLVMEDKDGTFATCGQPVDSRSDSFYRHTMAGFIADAGLASKVPEGMTEDEIAIADLRPILKNAHDAEFAIQRAIMALPEGILRDKAGGRRLAVTASGDNVSAWCVNKQFLAGLVEKGIVEPRTRGVSKDDEELLIAAGLANGLAHSR